MLRSVCGVRLLLCDVEAGCRAGSWLAWMPGCLGALGEAYVAESCKGSAGSRAAA